MNEGYDKIVEAETQNFRKLWFLDRYLANHDGYIAGGCFKDIFNGEPVKDIDIFFRDRSEFDRAKRYYERNEDFALAYDNDKTIAFRDLKSTSGIVIELIKKTFGEPIEMIETFDFSITKFAYYMEETPFDNEEDEDDDGTYMKNKIAYHKDFFEHLTMKRLVIDNKLDHPLNTLNRSWRYAGYGYGLCRESKEKLVKALQAVPEREIDFGKDFYDGVDW